MSATFNQINQASLARAIKKARQIKPRVHVNGFNDFTVAGSGGNKYSVKFTGKGLDFTAHCACTGSLNGSICYHAASAAPVYKLQVTERAAQTALCGECSVEVPAGCDLCDSCHDGLLAAGQIGTFCFECNLLPAMENSSLCSRCNELDILMEEGAAWQAENRAMCGW